MELINRERVDHTKLKVEELIDACFEKLYDEHDGD